MDTKEQPHSDDAFSTLALIERDLVMQRRANFFGWWHRLAAPATPAEDASLRAREAYRRGKYISMTLLAIICILAILLLLVGGFVNHNLIINLFPTLLITCLAVFFNRQGKVVVAGLLVVLVLDASLMAVLLGFPSFSAYLLPMLDLLVIPELFAASLLPPYFVFLDMSLHIVYFICALTFLFHKDAQLTALLAQPDVFSDILAKPIVIQAITAVIAFTWMRSVTQSVERADRATSIALLEKSIAEQAQADALQKRQLEDEIQEIIHVHSQVSNGNLDVRIPLRQGNLLWPVAGSLNSLITRLRGSLNDTRRLKQTDEAIIRFYQMRRERQNSIIPWQPTGTAIDVLVQQHNTFVQQQSHATRFPRHQKFEPK